MSTSEVVKIQRSEQQLPSLSLETSYKPHSVHQSKTEDKEKALAADINKQHLGKVGGETEQDLDEGSLLCKLYIYLL